MRFLAILLVAGFLAGEVIDRAVITVGKQVITELELEEEIRVAALLNGKPAVRNAEARRAAADRLVEQLLIRREMEMNRYPAPAADAVDKYLEEIKSDLGGQSALEQQLKAYDLDIPTLKEHLALQLTTLQFIEYRFRSDVGVQDSDIQAYYDQQQGAKRGEHAPAPSAAVRESIRQTLIEQRADEALDTWLEESRKRVNIVYLDKELQ